MKKIDLALMCVAGFIFVVACGGNASKKGKAAQAEGEEQAVAAAAAQQKAEEAKEPEKKAESKKWYEQDFVLTEKMYVMSACMTRTYARKGNIVIGVSEGSDLTNLYVCTDSSRTHYLIGNEKKTYVKRSEKTGFDSVDDAIYRYLKDQMSETVLGKKIKKGEEGVSAKDTTIFGRPAYVLTKEMTQKNVVAEVWGKTILHVDKENGLPYYKWAIIKTNGEVTTQGKVFEVTYFSDKPSYEGLIMSLDGLTEIQ